MMTQMNSREGIKSL